MVSLSVIGFIQKHIAELEKGALKTHNYVYTYDRWRNVVIRRSTASDATDLSAYEAVCLIIGGHAVQLDMVDFKAIISCLESPYPLGF